MQVGNPAGSQINKKATRPLRGRVFVLGHLRKLACWQMTKNKIRSFSCVAFYFHDGDKWVRQDGLPACHSQEICASSLAGRFQKIKKMRSIRFAFSIRSEMGPSRRLRRDIPRKSAHACMKADDKKLNSQL